MGKGHILNGPHEPLEEGSVVGVLLDHSENIAAASLQDIRQILVVAGHQVAMVIGELPILVGYCSNLHLDNVCVCVWGGGFKLLWLKFSLTVLKQLLHISVTMATYSGRGLGIIHFDGTTEIER